MTLCDIQGDYKSIVRATRVSYNSKKEHTLEEDLRLLRYLLTHNHMSPFEAVHLVYEVECPFFVARQFYRHRTIKTYGDDEIIAIGEDTIAGFNEYSMRYKTGLDIDWYIPDQFLAQSKTNKQQSSDPISFQNNEMFKKKILDLYESIYDLYEEMIENGVSREQARIILPQGSYTQFVATISVRHLIDFCVLRLDSGSQKECRDLAIKMINELKRDKVLYDLVKFGIGVRSPKLLEWL